MCCQEINAAAKEKLRCKVREEAVRAACKAEDELDKLAYVTMERDENATKLTECMLSLAGQKEYATLANLIQFGKTIGTLRLEYVRWRRAPLSPSVLNPTPCPFSPKSLF